MGWSIIRGISLSDILNEEVRDALLLNSLTLKLHLALVLISPIYMSFFFSLKSYIGYVRSLEDIRFIEREGQAEQQAARPLESQQSR